MQPKVAPVGLKPGDEFEHPWGVFEILDKRGAYTDVGDTREWYVRDPRTGEELWVDADFLLRIMEANITDWTTEDA